MNAQNSANVSPNKSPEKKGILGFFGLGEKPLIEVNLVDEEALERKKAEEEAER